MFTANDSFALPLENERYGSSSTMQWYKPAITRQVAISRSSQLRNRVYHVLPSDDMLVVPPDKGQIIVLDQPLAVLCSPQRFTHRRSAI